MIILSDCCISDFLNLYSHFSILWHNNVYIAGENKTGFALLKTSINERSLTFFIYYDIYLYK